MSRFTERMFGRNKNAVVNFIDLDNNNKSIASSGELTGKQGEPIDYDPTGKINEFLDRGYVLAQNNFNPDHRQPRFSGDDDTYVISFHHGYQTIDFAHPGFGFTKEQLQKKLKQTVHFAGAASRTPDDEVSEVSFKRSIKIDRVTATAVADQGWQPAKQNFLKVGIPTLPGFIPDKTVVGGKQVTPQDKDVSYTVNFKVNRQPSVNNQKAIIQYVDLTSNNQIITVDNLVGKPNMPIDYDPQNKIDELKQGGYVLVNNGFNAGGDIQFFSNDDNYVPVFVITMKSTAVAVDKKHPNDKVDPANYQRQVNFTVSFKGAGTDTPAPKTQTAALSRTVTAIPSTGQILEQGPYTSEWHSSIDQFKPVAVPAIKGFHADQKTVQPAAISAQNQEVTVNYFPNGHIVPVLANGQAITNADQPVFETDPHDPTKVLADEIVPKVKGYRTDLMTVTPEDAGQDKQVVFKQVKKDDVLVIPVGKHGANQSGGGNNQSASDRQSRPASQNEQTAPRSPQQLKQTAVNSSNEEEPKDQVAIINFIDVDHNGVQLTSSGPLVGKPGESINDLYSTRIPLKAIEKAGYEVVFNNFDRDGFVQRFDNNNLMTQIFTIGVRRKMPKGGNNSLMQRGNQTNGAKIERVTQMASRAQDLVMDQGEQDENGLVKEHSNTISSVISTLLDVVTTILSLIFMLGNGNKKDKKKIKK